MQPSTLVVIAILSALLYAIFAGAGVAFVSVNKLKQEFGKKKRFTTSLVEFLLAHPDSFMASMLIGSLASLVCYSLSAAMLLYPLLAVNIKSGALILTIESVALTILIVFTADIVPRAFSRVKPNTFLHIFSVPATFFFILFYPVAKIVSLMTVKSAQKNVGNDESEDSTILAKRNLISLSNEPQREDEEEDEAQEITLLRNALEFNEVRVKDCMTPRTEIVAVEVGDSLDNLSSHFVRSGFSRILVYADSIDNILGYIHIRDLFQKDKSLREIIRPVEFVPENMPAQKLLTTFIKGQKPIAVVVDEFGGTTGMLTIEDVMEEIIGDIDDEYDSESLIEKQLSSNRYIFSARLEVEYLNEEYDLDIPEADDYETLAGYIIFKNEEMPKPSQVMEFDNFRIRVLRMSASRLELVELIVNE